MGYTTVVFKDLESDAPFGKRYLMLVVFPNWQSRIPDIGEVGYVTYNEVIAGDTKWYCPETGQFIPYNYTNLVFVKFVKEQDNSTKEILL